MIYFRSLYLSIAAFLLGTALAAPATLPHAQAGSGIVNVASSDPGTAFPSISHGLDDPNGDKPRLLFRRLSPSEAHEFHKNAAGQHNDASNIHDKASRAHKDVSESYSHLSQTPRLQGHLKAQYIQHASEHADEARKHKKKSEIHKEESTRHLKYATDALKGQVWDWTSHTSPTESISHATMSLGHAEATRDHLAATNEHISAYNTLSLTGPSHASKHGTLALGHIVKATMHSPSVPPADRPHIEASKKDANDSRKSAKNVRVSSPTLEDISKVQKSKLREILGS